MNSKLKYDENTHYIKGNSFRLYPTEEQKELLDKFMNANRFIYNWALDLELKQYDKYEEAMYNCEDLPNSYIKSFELMKLLTQYRKENTWLQEIPNTTLRSGIIDLERAYRRYFKGISNLPKFKSKKKERNPHFHTRKDKMYIDAQYLKIEGVKEYIDLKFDTGYKKSDRNIYLNPTIKKDTLGNYFISFNTLEEKPIISNNNDESEVIGIDLNKHNYFALSNGKVYKSNTKKIKRLQKGIRDSHSEVLKDSYRRKEQLKELEKTNPDISIDDIPMSNRAKKRKARYDKRNAKLTNYVENEIHNITKDIIKSNPKGIVMENLNVEDLKSRHWCAKEIHDYSFGKCKVIMENKCNKYGVPFKLAPDKYPSSQICSNCGYSINIGTSTVFKCPNCGLTINRDINAAKNLANLFDSL